MPARSTIAFCAVITLFVLLSLAPSCNKAPDSGAAKSTGNQQPAAAPAADNTPAGIPPAAPAIDGNIIFAKANCTMCHGSSLEGGKLAPALTGLEANWEAGTLRDYLLDPAGYAAGDKRLAASISNYSLKMPAWNTAGFSDEELTGLIDWLLEH